MQHLKNYSAASILVMSALACSPAQNSQGTSASKLDSNAASSSKTKAATVPNFQSTDLGSSFNQASGKKLTLKPTEDKNKVFIVQRVRAFRSVWLNLTMDLTTTSNFWKFMKGFDLSGDAVQTDSISIHAPLASAGGSDNLSESTDRGDVFHVIGHAVSNSMNSPTNPTAILSLYLNGPQDADAQNFAEAMAAPKTYKKIFSRLGPLSDDLYSYCLNNEEINGIRSHSVVPDPAKAAKCEQVTAGGQKIFNMTDAQMGGNTYTGIGSMSEFYQKQTLVVWEPVPQDGYVCLGALVSNTPDVPMTASDAGGRYAQEQKTLVTDQNGDLVESYNRDYPVYCVQQKYATEGTLVPWVSSTNGADTNDPNKTVYFYKIQAKDATGYGDANLFWASTDGTLASKTTTKVYVLKKEFIRLLPDILK